MTKLQTLAISITMFLASGQAFGFCEGVEFQPRTEGPLTMAFARVWRNKHGTVWHEYRSVNGYAEREGIDGTVEVFIQQVFDGVPVCTKFLQTPLSVTAGAAPLVRDAVELQQ